MHLHGMKIAHWSKKCLTKAYTNAHLQMLEVKVPGLRLSDMLWRSPRPSTMCLSAELWTSALSVISAKGYS